MANSSPVQNQKVESKLQIKASAEQFYDIFCSKTYQTAKICPEINKSLLKFLKVNGAPRDLSSAGTLFMPYHLKSEANMTDSQVQKVEAKLQIKASAEQFFDIFCSKTYQIAKTCPEIKSVEIVEGEWGSEGSIVCWNFIHEGKAGMSNNGVFESIDWENKKYISKVIEGDLMKHYKSFKWILQITPQENGNLVHWTLEYEKKNNNIPAPNSLLLLTIKISIEIDAHLTQ